MRSLWFLVGFLTGVVSTGLGFLWLAARDGIEPPTGEALRDVLLGMHTVPADGVEAQVVRW